MRWWTWLLLVILILVPTAVPLGAADGLDRDCIAALDNLTLLRKDRLLRRVGELTEARMDQLCQALANAVACPWPR